MAGDHGPDVRGWLLVLAPLLVAPLALFLDAPWQVLPSVVVLGATFVLVSIDASSRDVPGSGHAVLSLVVWPVGYLRFLHARAANGGPRKLVFGVGTVLAVLSVSAFGSGAGAEVRARCRATSSYDATCTIDNGGPTLGRGCFVLTLRRDSWSEKSRPVCVRAFPGTTTKTLASPWDAVVKERCAAPLYRTDESGKLEAYDDDEERAAIEEAGGVGYCALQIAQAE